MNGDELTAAERSELRHVVVEGAQTLRARRRRATAFAGGALALILVGGISGGAVAAGAYLGAISAATPSPSVTPTAVETEVATPSPTPTPTAGPIPSAAQSAFDGDCGQMLSDEEVTSAVGTPMTALIPAWKSGAAEKLGGIECEWTTSEAYSAVSVSVAVFPAAAARVLDDEVSRSGCTRESDRQHCGLTSVVGDVWVHVGVRALDEAVQPATPDLADRVGNSLEDVVTARVAARPTTRAIAPGVDWWKDLTCRGILDDLAAAGSIPPGLRETEFGERPAGWIIRERNGVELMCFPEPGEETFVKHFNLWPGGADIFAQLAAVAESGPIEVPGAETAVVAPSRDALDGHWNTLVVTDGVNMLDLPIYEMDGLPSDEDIEFAAALLAVLAAR